MKIAEFDYNLPPEKIALYPPKIRGDAKLLVLDRSTGNIDHRQYRDLIDYVNPGDLVILNNTRVIKARLKTQRSTGGVVELFLLEKHGDDIRLDRQPVLHRGRLEVGEVLSLDKYKIIVTDVGEDGVIYVKSEKDLTLLADELGEVPIPPYLKRAADKNDEIRYQTLFAKENGSVAAPTASLNFTDELKNQLINKGVNVEFITLHVGMGTFIPVREEIVEDHKIHSEYYVITGTVRQKIRDTKSRGGKVIAVGTTVTRALEDASDLIFSNGFDGAIEKEANIYIYPGYEFKIVDMLLTNFHAPRSTVLLLAAAFAGKDQLLEAYQAANDNNYRFLSYGDSMLIV